MPCYMEKGTKGLFLYKIGCFRLNINKLYILCHNQNSIARDRNIWNWCKRWQKDWADM